MTGGSLCVEGSIAAIRDSAGKIRTCATYFKGRASALAKAKPRRHQPLSSSRS